MPPKKDTTKTKTTATKDNKLKVRIIKKAYGVYRRCEPTGANIIIDADLAEKMIDSGHAILDK